MKFKLVKAGMIVLALSLSQGLLSSHAMAPRPSSAQNKPLVLLPVRLRPLQAAFDLQRLRGATLMTYREGTAAQTVEVFLWENHAWRLLEPSESEMIVLACLDTSVFLVGDAKIVPSALAGRLAELAPGHKRVSSLQPVDLFNELDKACSFSKGEWEWLAERHGLTVVDQNASLRAGRPGTKPTLALPEDLSEEEMPPALIEVSGD